MKVSARVAVPVVLALLCAVAFLAFLWWKLHESSLALLEQRKARPQAILETEETGSLLVNLPPVDSRDQALLHLREGDMLAMRGEWASAQKEYEQAVNFSGGLPALRKLALAQLQRRDLAGLQTTIHKLKATGARPEDVALIENIVLLRTGELTEARKRLEQAQDSPQKHYGLSLLAIIEGNHEKAQKELKETANGWEPVLRSHARTLLDAYDQFAVFPESSDVHLVTLLSRALAQVQECELALPLLAQVTRERDGYRDAWIVQGYCELVTERPQQALASLEHAYNLNPEKPETQYFLARAHAALGEHDNAITYLNYALQNGFEPKAELRRLIAKEALAKGDGALALEQYKELVKDSDATIEAFDGGVSTAIALNEKDEAYALANQGANRFPDSARAFDLLGWAAEEAGKKKEAREALQKALEIDPFLASAKDRLEKLQQ